MKSFFTLLIAGSVAISGAASTAVKQLPANAKAPATTAVKRTVNGVLSSKLRPASNIMKAEDETVTLAVPTNVKMTANAHGDIDVTWDAVTDANYYVAEGAMIAPVNAGAAFQVANADFTGISSTGTITSPVESDYIYETSDQLIGAQFVLPVYINGAIGVEDNYMYAYYYDAYATVETGIYDLSIAKDKKMSVTVEVASGTGADFYCDLYAWDETNQEYAIVDEYVKTAISTDFQTLTFDLTGATDECFLSLYPYGDPDTYEFDGNLFFRSIKFSITADAAGEVTLPVLMWEGETNATAIDKKHVVGGNTYGVSVKAYQLDDEGNVTGESEYCDPVYYTAPAGISDVIADGDNAPAVYYNLQGMRLNNPEGICIEVRGGRATKVVK